MLQGPKAMSNSVKHVYSFPLQAIQFCLQQGQIRAQDLDYVAFFEKPFVKFEHLHFSILQTFPCSRRVFQESVLSWLMEKLWGEEAHQGEIGGLQGQDSL
jgi:carbamoyltransferase